MRRNRLVISGNGVTGQYPREPEPVHGDTAFSRICCAASSLSASALGTPDR